ncbi:heme NO-binding domain-containing protein [Paracoccus sp. (in: a-proteobacteria)]|uniref:heme NO-binding domain-containing protein n=1 Tax=Paracoccus sp. TaxID=267 RepID=UPI00396CB8BB
MYGLINRAIEEFLRSTYGEGLIQAVADEAAVSSDPSLPMYADFGEAALGQAALRLGKPQSEMYEDLGAWMTRVESIRRLLRFSGRDFRDFLLRLDELPGRVDLVLPTLRLPRLQIELDDHSVRLLMLEPSNGWQFLLVGLIRGMADDYGALCLIAVEEVGLRIDIWDSQFSEGRTFTLQGLTLTGAASA